MSFQASFGQGPLYGRGYGGRSSDFHGHHRERSRSRDRDTEIGSYNNSSNSYGARRDSGGGGGGGGQVSVERPLGYGDSRGGNVLLDKPSHSTDLCKSIEVAATSSFLDNDGMIDVARLIQSRRDLLPILKAKVAKQTGDSLQSARLQSFQGHIQYLENRIFTLCSIDPLSFRQNIPVGESPAQSSEAAAAEAPVQRRRSRFSDAGPS